MRKNLIMTSSLTLALMLTACSAESGSAKKPSPAAASSAESAASADEPAADQPTVYEPAVQENAIILEPFTPIDNDECTLTVKEYTTGGFFGNALKVTLENKSADKTYMFSVDYIAVNGVEIPSFFATEVAPLKKANDEILISDSNLSEIGIKEFTDIEVKVHVYDSNNWSADYVAEEIFHAYPYGEDKAQNYVRQDAEGDTVLVDNGQVKVVVTGYDEDNIWGYTVKLYLENKTDKQLMYSVDDASVNGFMADPFFATSVEPGKCYFTSMSWSDSTLEENDIEKVESIEFLLKVYDANDWMAGAIVNDTFTLNP